MESNPRVSVVIPAYNSETTIKQSIESVFNQTIKDFEIIVIDDGSTDETSLILKSIADDRLKVFRQSNSGVSSARNKGINKAKGRFIAFLDSDDYWLPNKLEIQLNYFQKDQNLDLISTSAIFCTKYKLKYKNSERKKGRTFKRLLKGNHILTSSCMVKRDLLENYSGFDSSITLGEDWEFWLRLAKENRFLTISDPLVLYKVHPNQKYSTHIHIRDRKKILESLMSLDYKGTLFKIYVKRLWLSNTYLIAAPKMYYETNSFISFFHYFTKGILLLPFNFKGVIRSLISLKKY